MKLFHFTWIAHLPAMLGMKFADGRLTGSPRQRWPGALPDSARQEKIATTYGLINRINPISETRQPIEFVQLLTGQQCFLRRKTHPAGEPRRGMRVGSA